MTTLTKVLIGTAVVAGVGAVAGLVAVNKKEKKVDVAEQTVKKDEDGSLIKRIKRFVKRKFIKFLAFVALHMEQIEAISAVIGLASGAIGIASAIRDFKNGNDTQEKLDAIDRKLDNTLQLIVVETDALGKYEEHCCRTIVDNQKTIDKDIFKIGEKLGVKMLEDDEVFSA